MGQPPLVASRRGGCTVIAPGRPGRTKWSAASLDILLARELTWSDAGKPTAAIGRATRPIVIVGSREPLPEIWSGRIPPVIPLSRFATLQDGRLELEHECIAAAIAEADSAAASRPTTFTAKMLKEQTGREVTKDQVAFAVRRLGGPAARVTG